MNEMIIDNFAGGGGASTGIELAIGRSVDVAINHDPAAIAMHEANHPNTKHYCENVWDVDPREVAGDRPVGLVWLSPDCTHHSKARGGKPREKNIRGLAWVAVRWAATVKPRVMMLENVEEFQDWGPLDKDCKPIKSQKGRTFRSFINALKRHGYAVEWQVLHACDYGAPTTRKRLFLVARCDGRPIIWPEPSHAETGSRPRYRTASECMEWDLPSKSIFERKKPLADNTLRRIDIGFHKFIINNPNPFFAPVSVEVGDHTADVAAFLIQYHSESASHEARGQTLDRPIMTLDTSNRYALVTAFLISYYGASIGSELIEPLHTITTKDRFGLVTVHSKRRQIADIQLRMLTPRELYRCQGFPESYIINPVFNGRPFTHKEQVAKCGNSVSPVMPNAIVRSNLPELCVPEYSDRFSWEAMLA